MYVEPSLTYTDAARQVAGMGRSGSDLRLGPLLPDRSAQPTPAEGGPHSRSNSWQIEEARSGGGGACCGGSAKQACCGAGALQLPAAGTTNGLLSTQGSVAVDVRRATGKGCCGGKRSADDNSTGSGSKGAGGGCGQDLSLDLKVQTEDDPSKRCKTAPGSPRLHKVRIARRSFDHARICTLLLEVRLLGG